MNDPDRRFTGLDMLLLALLIAVVILALVAIVATREPTSNPHAYLLLV